MSVDFSMFDMSNQSFVKNETNESEFYKPDATKSQNGTYEALVRFIPYIKDKRMSLIEKYTAFIADPITDDKRTLDSLRTLGKEEGRKCPIVKTFFKVRESKDASIKAHEDMFKQKQVYYALVQILEDKQNPDLVGQIKIMKFGPKLKVHYDNEEQPKKGKARNPFDIIKGRPFFLDVRMVEKYNNYDSCKFIDVDEDCVGNVMLDGKPIDFNNVDEKTMKKLQDFLTNNSPDITKYGFREWTTEDHAFFDNVVNNIFGGATNGQHTSNILNSGKSKKSHILEEDEEDDDVPVVRTEVPKAKKVEAKPAPKKVIEDDDDDEVFDGLDDIDLDDM